MTDLATQAREMIERLEKLAKAFEIIWAKNVKKPRPETSTVKDAAALIRALLAEREWRDMDSAPKDGTWIELTGGDIDYLCWDGNSKPPVVIAQWSSGRLTARERWQFAWYDGGYYGEYENPTKWRPLPKGEA